MANLTIFIRAKDEASRTLNKTASATKTLGDHVKALAGYIGVAFATAEVVRFGKESVEAFDAIEKSRMRLQFGLDKMHRVGAGALDAITKSLRTFSLQTGVSQQDLTDLAGKVTNLGGTFLKSMGSKAPDIINRLTQALVDAKAAGAKFRETMIPAIVNTPAKAASQLQRLGVLTQDQVNLMKAYGSTTKKQLKTLVDNGTITKKTAQWIGAMTLKQRQQNATQIEVNALSKKWQGAAKATATWQDKLRARWEDIKIAVGGFLVGAGAKVFDFLTKHAQLMKTLGAAIGAVVGAWLLYTGAMKVVAGIQLLVNALMEANPVGLIALAVIALAAVIVTNWTTIKQVTIKVWHSITSFLANAWHAIVRVFNFTPLAIYFKVWFAVIKGIIAGAVAAWKNVISPAIHGILNVVKSVLGTIRSVWNNIWSGLAGPVQAIMSTVLGIVKTGINGVIHAINALIHGYNLVPGHTDIPTIPTLRRGGVVAKTGFAIVHEGERFSGVGPGATGMGDTYNVKVENHARPWEEQDLARVLRRASLLRGAQVA